MRDLEVPPTFCEALTSAKTSLELYCQWMQKTLHGEVGFLRASPRRGTLSANPEFGRHPITLELQCEPPKECSKCRTRYSQNPVSGNLRIQEPTDSQTTSQPTQIPSTPTTSSPRTQTNRGPRAAKKVAVPATRLEPVDGSLDPLGPLGGDNAGPESEQPPIPPLKEQSLPIRNARQAPPQSPMGRNILDAADLGDDDRASAISRQRQYSQGQLPPSGLENSRRQNQPSVSIEQAARPTFDITVGDPHKVGDLTSSHIVYQVRTKVNFV